MTENEIPKLPPLLNQKINKTGQTRGADDDVIYQNRVSRNNTVLIPLQHWIENPTLRRESSNFEKGFIVLVNPKDYFEKEDPISYLESFKLKLSVNALVSYETRNDWSIYPPLETWEVANSRTNPLGGEYIARVPATTANQNSAKINLGFTGKPKGAGIRLYEYASAETIKKCKTQLEAIYWLCEDSIEAAASFGMTQEDAQKRKNACLLDASKQGLLDYNRLIQQRIIDQNNITICPFCLKKLKGKGFFSRLQQAAGREVPDLTVTEINLFHIDELKYGQFNHKEYNLGWGHHHCNVVVKDSGIYPTLEWIRQVLDENILQGYIKSKKIIK